MTLSKPTRFRKAVLRLSANDTYARELTVDDVTARWSHLASSGYAPIDLVKIANSEDIDNDVFLQLMRYLNSYL